MTVWVVSGGRFVDMLVTLGLVPILERRRKP